MVTHKLQSDVDVACGSVGDRVGSHDDGCVIVVVDHGRRGLWVLLFSKKLTQTHA